MASEGVRGSIMSSAAVTNAPRARRVDIISRDQVEDLIADGKHVVIVDGAVLKIDAWLPFHPGGDKAIKHMVGRDATDEVNALHSSEARARMSSYQIGRIEGQWQNLVPPIQGGIFKKRSNESTSPIMEPEKPYLSSSPRPSSSSSSASSISGSPVFEPLRKRAEFGDSIETASTSSASVLSLAELPEPRRASSMDTLTQEQINVDLAKFPPLDMATQQEIVQKYRLLAEKIRSQGLFDCNYTAYLFELGRYILLASLCGVFLRSGWYATSGLFLGLLWHQLTFTCHDAGHMGITHDYHVDTTIGILLADFIGGLSLGWWKRSHNVHHIVTNSPEHDPDIEHMPFFAISHRFFSSLWSTYHEKVMTYDAVARTVIRHQHYLYYPILLFGRFNLYAQSWIYLILGLGPRKGAAARYRWLELAGQLFFWFWFGYMLVYRSIPRASARIVFVLVSHMVTAPLHVQITLSHFAMSTADLGPAESFPQKMLRTTMDVDCPAWLDFVHGGLQFQAIHHLFPRIPRHNLRATQRLVQQFCNEVGIPYALYGFVDGNREVIGRLGEVGRQAAILTKCQEAAAEKMLSGGGY